MAYQINHTAFQYHSFVYIIHTLSVITTLLFSPFIEAFLILGILMLAVGNIIPIAPMVIFLNRCIVEISAAFSDLPFAYVSSEFLPVKILSFVICAMFASLLFLDVRRKGFTCRLWHCF
ncbi:MAG: hypothetical protein IKB23_08095 [Clostridia bacterium]|nr:hypothetical protein [Clostridia bacterium]